MKLNPSTDSNISKNNIYTCPLHPEITSIDRHKGKSHRIPCNTCEFKVLLNDTEYELGENHLLKARSETHYTPLF